MVFSKGKTLWEVISTFIYFTCTISEIVFLAEGMLCFPKLFVQKCLPSQGSSAATHHLLLLYPLFHVQATNSLTLLHKHSYYPVFLPLSLVWC